MRIWTSKLCSRRSFQHYTYGYNGQGELATVTLPSVATPQEYTYDPVHLLKTLKDARGNTVASGTYDGSGRVLTETDAVGSTKSYAYNLALRTTTTTNPDTGVELVEQDGQGNVVCRVDGLNRTWLYSFDANNNQLTETNPLGKTWTNTYNAQGFKTSVRDPLNHTNSAVFNAYGGPTSVTNGVNFTQSVTYDAAFNINVITDALGQVAQFTWNAKGLPLTLKDARGNTSTYGYDAYGNRVSYTDPEGRTTASTFNSYGQMLTQTDARGNATSYTYDELGRRLTMRDAGNGLWTYGYDGNGNKTSEVDALNRTTGYEYDAKNRLTKTTYPDATFTQTTYDFRDKPLTVTDQLGRVTKSEYDLAGQLKKVTYAFGTADAAAVEYTYDLAGRRLTEKDERGNVTTSAYDDAGRLISVTNAQGKVKAFGYDDADRRISSTDEKNRVTVFEFDGRGRNTKVTYADGKFVTHGYDGLGLRTSTTDQDLRTTVWAYDKASQLTSVTNALSQITSYGYDLAGNKIRQTDANSHQTAYEYDALNRRTRRTLPAGQYEAFTYDAVGNMLTRRNFNAKTTTHAYDSMNRLLSMTPDASLSGQTPITFTYGGTGKRLTMADASGTTSWTYDFRDRVKTKATPQGTLTYGYHPNSLVASVVSSNVNGVNVSYAYDSLNRLQSVTDQAGATGFTWDDAGNPATMTYPNGVVHTFGTDVMDRMNVVTLTKTPNTLASFSYTFGNSGNRLTATESGGRSMSWGYDAVYRLTSEAITPEGNVTYGLDAVGNRLSRTSTIAAIPSTTNTFDLNDRISGDTFDDNGNTLTSGGQTFGYDFLDRLTSYNGGAVTMVYDGDGNRVAKTAAGVMTRYLVDDLTPTGYAQVAEEVVAGNVVRRYTHGTIRISQTIAGVTHYYGYDGGLHVRSLSDATGAVTDTFAHDAFGNLVARTGTTANDYLYRGEQYDGALEMYYLRARWYGPQVGRFLTPDTEEGMAAEPVTLNLYQYSGGNPVNMADPSGHGFITSGMWTSRVSTLSRLYAFAATQSMELASCVAMKAAAFHIQTALGPVATAFTVACGTATRLGPLGEILEREFVVSINNIDAVPRRLQGYVEDALAFARQMGFNVIAPGGAHAELNVINYVARKGEDWALLNLGTGWRACQGGCAPTIRSGLRWTSFNLATCFIF